MALLIAGSVETAVGRDDDALDHLSEAHELADRFDNHRLMAATRLQLGMLAAKLGRLDEARAQLDEAVDLQLDLATYSPRKVTVCLAAFAIVALREGDPERAALLLGAADGIRRRAGLRAWPNFPRAGTDMVGRIRQMLGTDRFDVTFAAGSRLSQAEAIAAVGKRPAAGIATS